MEELENQTNETNVQQGPLTIPFGGHVCVGTGIYKNDKDGVYAGAMELRWMENARDVGSWLDEDENHLDATPLVRMVFPKIESVDTMISQLIVIEYAMVKNRLSREDLTSEDVRGRLMQSFDKAMARIESIECSAQ